MPFRHLILGLLATATLLAGPAVVRAADLDDNYGYADQMPAAPVIPESKVEFGSGWYVRGDVGATRLPSMGLDTSTGGIPNISIGNGSQIGYDASLGAGYEINRWFRADVTADFHKPLTVRAPGIQHNAFNDPMYNYQNTGGTCQIGYVSPVQNAFYPAYLDCHSEYEGHVQSYDVLANGYASLGQYGIVSPYIGTGIGLSFGTYSSGIAYYFNDGAHYDTTYALTGSDIKVRGYADQKVSKTYYNFAFALMAGLSVNIYDHTKLDIGYRYLNLGQVLGTTLQYHEARIGLRYMIDN